MILVALVAIVAIGIWAAVDALAARSKLITARNSLENLENSGSLTRASAGAQISQALTETRQAQSWLGQPGSVVLAHVPLLGRTWVAERTIADASTAVLRASDVLLGDASDIGTGGRVDLGRLAAIQRQLAATHAAVAPVLGRLADLETGLTPAPVGSAVRQAQQRLVPIGADLARAAAGAGALHDIFGGDGPRTILIGLQNNAELRATGGLIGSFAYAHSRDGRLRVGAFRDVNKIAQSPGYARTVPAPVDYSRTYRQFLANSTLWKNVNFSPSVPDSAAVLANVAQRSIGTKPDAVLLLDAPAIAALVQGSGLSVHLPDGTEATGATLVHDLLVQSYGATPNSPRAQAARRAGLERAAGVTLRQALSEAPSLTVLRALAQQVSGDHVTLWSDRPAVEAQLVAAGAAGSLSAPGSDVAMISADNLGDSPNNGNKLDYYAQRSVAIVAALSKTAATVQQTVTIHNAAPAGLPAYVQGVRHPGRLSELWSFVVPADAGDTAVTVDGKPAGSRSEPIDGLQQVMTFVTTSRGATSTIRVTYRVPITDGNFRLRVIPQPLASPASLSIRIYGTGGPVVKPPVEIREPFTDVTTVAAHAS